MANTKKRPYRERKAEMERLVEECNQALDAAQQEGIRVPEERYRVRFWSEKRARRVAIIAIVVAVLAWILSNLCPSLYNLTVAIFVIAVLVAAYSEIMVGETFVVGYGAADDFIRMQDWLEKTQKARAEIKQLRVEKAELIERLETLKPTVRETLKYYNYGVYYSLEDGAYVQLKNYFHRLDICEEAYEIIVEQIMLERQKTEPEEKKRARRQELVKEFEESLEKEGK